MRRELAATTRTRAALLHPFASRCCSGVGLRNVWTRPHDDGADTKSRIYGDIDGRLTSSEEATIGIGTHATTMF